MQTGWIMNDSTWYFQGKMVYINHFPFSMSTHRCPWCFRRSGSSL